MSYKAEVLADSPLVYLPFAGDSLTTNLGSRTGVTVNSSGGYAFGTGIQNRAPIFTGPSTAAHVSYDVNNNNIFNGTTWAVEAWFQRNASQNDYMEIFFTASGTSQIEILVWTPSGADNKKLIGRIKDGSGNVVQITGPAITDTNWHHVVMTTNGTTVTMYLDGSSVGTATHYTQTFSSGAAVYLASYTTTSGQANFWGGIDEVAMYNTTLSSTRVSAHYAARNDLDVDAAPATGSGTAPTIAFGGPEKVDDFADTYSSGDWTLDAGVSNSVVSGKYEINYPASPTSYAVYTKMPHLSNNYNVLVRIKASASVGAMEVGVGSAALLRSIPNPNLWYWMRFYNVGTTAYSKVWENSQTEPGSGTNEGTAVFNEDIYFEGYGSVQFLVDYIGYDVTGATVPIPSLPAEHVNVAADPATGSGTFVDPAVGIWAGYTAQPMTGSGEMVSPPHSIEYVASPATGSGEMADGTFTQDQNVQFNAPVATGSGVLLDPDEVDQTADPYYAEIYATSDTGDYWYRLDETSGTVVHDARGDSAKDANLSGTYSFSVIGPESRKATHFENGYFSPVVGSTVDSQGALDSETARFAFEIVLKTTDQNGVIAYGLDNRPFAAIFRNAIYLKDGKVSIEWNRLDGGPTPLSLTGFKNVADGEWHHIVVAYSDGHTRELDNGIRIYIDGQLDVRRRTALIPDVWATPDSYMGMPEAWRLVTPLYPWQDNLTGDVMEVVFRRDADMVQDQFIELYYDAFGIIPVRVTPATATGLMPNAVGEGNTKNALVLYVKWSGGGLERSTLIGDERNAPSSASTSIPDEFDHQIIIGGGEASTVDIGGFRVNSVSIMREDSNSDAGPYRDPITDLPRLINLQEDLDLSNYDVIAFRNWPDEGADQVVFSGRGYTNDAVEDFLASVRQAVVDGMGLEVTNINLASRLGLITSAQAIPMLYDRDSSGGETDYRAYAVNPWGESGSVGLDVHANNWHRVTAQVQYLTDADSEYISDLYLTHNSGTNGEVNNRWGYKLTEGPLTIGTELFDTAVFWNRIRTFINGGVQPAIGTWDRYVWAVTPSGLAVGTPVYKFGNTMWTGNTEVDNPYKEYIGGAVVQPGDNWNGQNVAGKVFMNFAEIPYYAMDMGTLVRQIVPPNEEITNPLQQETTAMREWDYSYTRVENTAIASGGAVNGQANIILVQNPDGSVSYEVKSGGALVGINEFERWPTEVVLALSWAQRGWAWLANVESVPSGSVVIRPTPATATATAPAPVTVAEQYVTVTVTPAQAVGVMLSPDEAADADVTVFAFPAEGSGTMTGYGKTIAVDPFIGSGEMVDNFDLISASGEQVVLYLHALTEVELYLKEGTK
jgi:hypothetical protein